MSWQRAIVVVVACAAILSVSCASLQPTPAAPRTPFNTQWSELDVQSLVMQMADDYSAALGEAMQPIIRSAESGPTARYLAQEVLRNGMGSALSIAVGPNPDASLLDLLVLTSLQHWSFSANWVPLGISEAQGQIAAARLHMAEEAAWQSASSILSDEQTATLRSLIDAWIKAHPDRQFVSFVRFEEFVDIRNGQSVANRARADGLFREVAQASATVDAARLFGERVLWYAARYPQVLGQQAEVTLFRFASQPEFRSILEVAGSINTLASTLSTRMEAFERGMTAQQDHLFSRLATERTAAIEQASVAISDVVQRAMEDLDKRVAASRDATITQAFDRIDQERRAIFDDLDSRAGGWKEAVASARETIGMSQELAIQLQSMADSFDHLVARFDREDRPGSRALDVRAAVAETSKMVEQLTLLVDKTSGLANSDVWNKRMLQIDQATTDVIDRTFWRGLWLVLVLLGGLAIIRRIPQRVAPQK